eukprot:COSAG02_NODE_54241_length_297_cov_0.777778_1_plen_35_part_01
MNGDTVTFQLEKWPMTAATADKMAGVALAAPAQPY